MSARFFTCIDCSPGAPPHPAPSRGALPTRCAEHRAAARKQGAAARAARFRARRVGQIEAVNRGKKRNASQTRFDQRGVRVIHLALSYGKKRGHIASWLTVDKIREIVEREDFEALIAEAWAVRRLAPRGYSNENTLRFILTRIPYGLYRAP